MVLKPLYWIGSAKRDLLAMLKLVREVVGFALYLAQAGDRHPDAKPLKGFSSAGVVEVVVDQRGNAYRAVYTVRIHARVYVLHCFQKKSHHGIETPKHDVDLIRERLRAAEVHAREKHHD